MAAMKARQKKDDQSITTLNKVYKVPQTEKQKYIVIECSRTA
jgi:hypothetical protein